MHPIVKSNLGQIGALDGDRLSLIGFRSFPGLGLVKSIESGSS